MLCRGLPLVKLRAVHQLYPLIFLFLHQQPSDQACWSRSLARGHQSGCFIDVQGHWLNTCNTQLGASTTYCNLHFPELPWNTGTEQIVSFCCSHLITHHLVFIFNLDTSDRPGSKPRFQVPWGLIEILLSLIIK